MNTKGYVPTLLVAAATFAAIYSSASAQESAYTEPKYKADVPQSLITPDKVQTELLGELEFALGMPTEATVKKTYDFIGCLNEYQNVVNHPWVARPSFYPLKYLKDHKIVLPPLKVEFPLIRRTQLVSWRGPRGQDGK